MRVLSFLFVLGLSGWIHCATSFRQPLPALDLPADYKAAEHLSVLDERPHPFVALGPTPFGGLPSTWLNPAEPAPAFRCTWTRLGPVPMPSSRLWVSLLVDSAHPAFVDMILHQEGERLPHMALPLVSTPMGVLMGTRTLPPPPANKRYHETLGDREEYLVLGRKGTHLVGEFHRLVGFLPPSPWRELPLAALIPSSDPYRAGWRVTGTLVCDEDLGKSLPLANPG